MQLFAVDGIERGAWAALAFAAGLDEELEADTVIAPAHGFGLDSYGPVVGCLADVGLGEGHANDGAGVPALGGDDKEAGEANVANFMRNGSASGEEVSNQAGNGTAEGDARIGRIGEQPAG